MASVTARTVKSPTEERGDIEGNKLVSSVVSQLPPLPLLAVNCVASLVTGCTTGNVEVVIWSSHILLPFLPPSLLCLPLERRTFPAIV